MEELPLIIVIILQVSDIWVIQLCIRETSTSISTQILFNSPISNSSTIKKNYIRRLAIIKTASFFVPLV